MCESLFVRTLVGRVISILERPIVVHPSADRRPWMVGCTLARCPPKHIPVAGGEIDDITNVVCIEAGERQTCYPTVATLQRAQKIDGEGGILSHD